MKIIGEDEEINLDFNRKKFINKMLVFGTLAVVVIICSSIAGIHVAKSYNSHLLSKYYSEEQNVEKNENNLGSENNSQNFQENKQENTKGEENIKENVAQNQKENPEERLKETLKLPIYSEDAQKRINNIYNSNDEEKIAYLTFDDGPSSNITPQILQTLKDENIKATFFVLGSRVEANPELVKQEYEAGHYIANHGYSHDYSKVYASEKAILDEYNRTETSIKKAIGNENYSSHLFRFPGGSQGGKYAKIKNSAKSLLAENNIAYINWNCLTNDAVGKPTAESVVSDLKETSKRKK